MRFQYAINMNARGFHASSALDEMISTHFSSWLSFLLLLLLFSTDRISSVGAFSLTSPFTEFFFYFLLSRRFCGPNAVHQVILFVLVSGLGIFASFAFIGRPAANEKTPLPSDRSCAEMKPKIKKKSRTTEAKSSVTRQRKEKTPERPKKINKKNPTNRRSQ